VLPRLSELILVFFKFGRSHYLIFNLIFIRIFHVGFVEVGLRRRSTFILRAFTTGVTDKSVSCAEGTNLLTRRC
jgi:hypothetical protein